MSFTIRLARADDAPEVRALLVRTWHATYDSIFGAEKVTEITDRWHAESVLVAQTESESTKFHVVEINGAIVATSLAKAGLDGNVELSRLYVDPRHQRAGLGHALLKSVQSAFPQARRMKLEVEPANTKARSFYAQFGFEEIARTDACGGDAGVAQAALILEAPLPLARIRSATDADAQDLFGLLTLCFAEYPGCYTDPHDDLPDLVKPGHWKEREGADGRSLGGEFLVVEDERGRVCACVALDYPKLEADGCPIAELHRLYVRADQRGRGLAARLVAHVEAMAREAGARRIELWSDTRFATAHRLYERLGYARGGARTLADVSNSREFFFAKSL